MRKIAIFIIILVLLATPTHITAQETKKEPTILEREGSFGAIIEPEWSFPIVINAYSPGFSWDNATLKAFSASIETNGSLQYSIYNISYYEQSSSWLIKEKYWGPYHLPPGIELFFFSAWSNITLYNRTDYYSLPFLIFTNTNNYTVSLEANVSACWEVYNYTIPRWAEEDTPVADPVTRTGFDKQNLYPYAVIGLLCIVAIAVLSKEKELPDWIQKERERL